MTAQTKIEPPTLAKLREPFPENQISKLPKETRNQIDARKTNKSLMVWKCAQCGGAHHKDAVHLDYVGHAAATDRLLDVDLRWTWDPVPDPASLGLPTVQGGMWIKLTVDGVSRYGFGCADGKTGGDAIKEIIGDAIRNAGMRFGMALDLWHKGDLHVDDTDDAEKADDKTKVDVPESMPDAPWAKLCGLLEATNTSSGVLVKHYKVKNLRLLNKADYEDAVDRLEQRLAEMAKTETNWAGEAQSDAPGDFADGDIPY